MAFPTRVVDDRFDALTALQDLGQGFEFAPVNDLDVGVVLIDPTFAVIDADRLGWRGDAFEMNGGLSTG